MDKIEKSTIIRTIILIIALINQIIVCLGYNPLPFDDADITNIVSVIVTVLASLWSWWKNNSFTKEAIKADNYLKECKNCKKE
ncbi:MAG: phage holin [Lachnospirales bacterium]